MDEPTNRHNGFPTIAVMATYIKNETKKRIFEVRNVIETEFPYNWLSQTDSKNLIGFFSHCEALHCKA